MALLRIAVGVCLAVTVASARARAGSVDVGDEIPAISVSDASGAALELNLDGDGVTAVEFWATWCPACRATLPSLAQLASEHRADGFRVVAINIDQSQSTADSYLSEHLAAQRDVLQVAYDPGGGAMARLGSPGLPALYVVENGTVRLVQGGWQPDGEQNLRRMVDTLLRRQQARQGDPACEPSSCSR